MPPAIGTVFFALAILHTFFAKKHLELVFAFWAGPYLLLSFIGNGVGPTLTYLQSLHFGMPLLVVALMFVAGLPQVLKASESFILRCSPNVMALYILTLVLGPLLSSLITEPAAMAITAHLLRRSFFSGPVSARFKYATFGLLLVNVSVGGTLTHFAAPPVAMVAGPWGWDTPFMLSHFGLKAILSVLVSTLTMAWYFRNEILAQKRPTESQSYLFSWKEPLLVGAFLAGLTVLGGAQEWWVRPLLGHMGELSLYFGAALLTSVTDNAALTYLGTLADLTDSAKYYLVSGAVVGGGLTVIANAPNPVAYGILKDSFPGQRIGPMGIFWGALGPTLVALLSFLMS